MYYSWLDTVPFKICEDFKGDTVHLCGSSDWKLFSFQSCTHPSRYSFTRTHTLKLHLIYSSFTLNSILTHSNALDVLFTLSLIIFNILYQLYISISRDLEMKLTFVLVYILRHLYIFNRYMKYTVCRKHFRSIWFLWYDSRVLWPARDTLHTTPKQIWIKSLVQCTGP